ncbi:MAG: alpha-galactosidase [Spirochaetales bacterium]|nr:alpha-galactosidase [Spirochaetales bacterium]
MYGERRRKQFRPGEDLRWDHGVLTWRDEKVPGGRRLRAFCETGEKAELLVALMEGKREYPHEERVFCNGFQSWTTSREYRTGERIPKLSPLGRLFSLDRYGDYHFVSPFRRGAPLYSHSWTYLRREDSFHFIGSLAEIHGYTLLLHDPPAKKFAVVRDCQGVIRRHEYPLFDLFLASGREEEVFSSFLSLQGLQGQRRTLTGWTSWYNYYNDITEEIILKNLQAFQDQNIPAQVFQIDDGYQTAVGDWFSLKDSFPRGMKYLADRIKEAGYCPGIWLAPFVCARDSEVRKKHPEWILLDSQGKPIRAGWIPPWGGSFYALDIYHEGFRKHLREVFHTVVKEWGYRVLKLDFLYAAAMVPRLGKSRGEVMAEASRFLAEISEGADILGCGVPLASCMGVFSFCRIGSDVALKWEDKLLSLVGYRERVSTINSLNSTLGRRQIAGRAFLNDPDVFVLRDSVAMNRDQRETLFLLNVLLGDVLFTSDYLEEYPPETLAFYRSLFPVRERKVSGVNFQDRLAIIDFTVGTAVYRAFANLGDTMTTVILPEDAWVLQQTAWNPSEPEVIGSLNLSPGTTRYAQRLSDKLPRIAGGAGHLFPAAFVESLKANEKDIDLTFSLDTPAELKVYLSPPEPGRYRVNGILRETEYHERGIPFIEVSP